MLNRFALFLTTAALITGGCQSLLAQDAPARKAGPERSAPLQPGTTALAEFGHWPAEAEPERVGKLVAENFAARKFNFETNPKRQHVIYPEACAWYGSLTTAKLLNDRDLQTKLIHKFDLLLTPDGANHISTNAHVDYRVFGIVPLEIFIQTGGKPPRMPGTPGAALHQPSAALSLSSTGGEGSREEAHSTSSTLSPAPIRYLEIGQALADKQWENTTRDGITREARYWVDDMYMITAVQVQAFRATGDAKYLERAALTMSAYLDKLQQTNGLFYHAPDVPFFWGRGNGWFAAGMSELLRSLPDNHPQRARILKGYRRMMASLLQYQGADGLWRQLIDHPEAWPETSGTGMFTFAMITGVENGWLDEKTYSPAARKGWLGLVSYLNPNGDIREVCEGTGKKNDLAYYLARARKAGDLHGQAPLLWCASALLRYTETHD